MVYGASARAFVAHSEGWEENETYIIAMRR